MLSTESSFFSRFGFGFSLKWVINWIWWFHLGATKNVAIAIYDILCFSLSLSLVYNQMELSILLLHTKLIYTDVLVISFGFFVFFIFFPIQPFHESQSQYDSHVTKCNDKWLKVSLWLSQQFQNQFCLFFRSSLDF